MRRKGFIILAFTMFAGTCGLAQTNQVKIENGTLEGTTNAATGIRSFKGIPFAAPPVGDLRWKEPQPVQNWEGVRKADHFGNNAMQKNVFGDMMFRSSGMSEDCLYLNVWTPAKSSKVKLPVLVYFYGGGFVAGDGSESRYDGESMAQKGIVTLTVNYRLGVFGFLAHPELTAESPHHASGDYGLLDQHAALEWVKKNIAAFGGNPHRVTIAGESAGSIAVCAQMVSPLSKNLIAGAIGESGGMIAPTIPAIPLADGEKNGVAFAQKVNASSLAALRAIPADQLLEMASKQGMPPMSPTVDGYFLTKSPNDVFAAGEQAHVPLLVGWNSAEVPYQAFIWGDAPTPENYL
ncbi:MAG TPA: carboxylesterase family protein, partial [Mucilaginibacter sp.]|nr:carboxylesterase family protein [Mucilaginibacter sp.]